jgi:hypothetical protein
VGLLGDRDHFHKIQNRSAGQLQTLNQLIFKLVHFRVLDLRRFAAWGASLIVKNGEPVRGRMTECFLAHEESTFIDVKGYVGQGDDSGVAFINMWAQ